MKVQIFRQSQSADVGGGQDLIVQFRRKKDDVVAFNNIFKEVSSELQKYANLQETSTRAPDITVPNFGKLDLPEGPALSTYSIGTEPGSDVQPLLDMLVNTAWQAGQIEAMTALVNLLTRDNVVIESVLRALSKTSGVYQQLQELSTSPDVEVNYPAKLLVSRLKDETGDKC